MSEPVGSNGMPPKEDTPMQRLKLLWLALPALTLASLPAAAQTESRKEVVAAGGGRIMSAGHRLLCTIGQPCVGAMSTNAHRHLIGFHEPIGAPPSGTDDVIELPLHFDLAQNAPNPFVSATTIRFALPESREVRLEIFSVDGRRVASLVNDTLSPGHLALRWDGRDSRGRPVASGAYLYRLTAGDFTATRRMLLTR